MKVIDPVDLEMKIDVAVAVEAEENLVLVGSKECLHLAGIVDRSTSGKRLMTHDENRLISLLQFFFQPLLLFFSNVAVIAAV